MARPASKYPTEFELAILKILWGLGPQRVKDVRHSLLPERKLAYTSVMTIMNIMVDKGYLARTKSGASFVYRPLVSREDTVHGILRDVVSRVFDGSASAVMLSLLESSDIDQAEIGKLRRLLKSKSEAPER